MNSHLSQLNKDLTQLCEGGNFGEIFDQNPYMAVVIVDKNNIVTFINKTYLKILQLPMDKVLRKPLTDITPATKTAKVLMTGKAITAYNWKVNGQHLIACSVPLFKNKEIVGCFAYSISLNIWDSKTLVEDLLSDITMLREEVHKSHTAQYKFDDIVGNDKRLLHSVSLAKQVARQTQTKVLITGETGTGKELFAHSIHNASARSHKPFVRVNCAAIPENLLEAELFGYEEGAFTGAKKGGRLGKFELANHGTIFLDEIGEIPLSLQSKLLVVLQEREIERLGGNRSVKLDVRVISATHRNLQSMAEKGLFRKDLYYRLNVVQVEVPALRHRKEDITLLVEYLLHKLKDRLKTPVVGISRGALEMLKKHVWPGNVRELENVLERAMSLAYMENAYLLDQRHFTFIFDKISATWSPGRKSLREATHEFEQRIITQVMEETGSNKAQAAELLGIDLSSLYRKLKKYGISMD
ncbi:sigma-54 interaction domain-containing protein [Desulfosporosinus youngiae]|uniref:sigma-54 interaction domain-containing protein n=1 Tax=Desulfosporosinus youngiae TaxID=339862 RepID=UPI00031B4F69|nr:sigma 54-interacting transcriptional regulator [Desulfosporosinus youngiae]